MKKIYVLLIIITMLFTACQSTPEDSVVNRRSYDKLLKKNDNRQKEEYPSKYQECITSKDGKVKIIIDAKVITPDTDMFPVIQINPQPISQEIMQLFVDKFMEGETGYYPEDYMIKSEIEERLLKYYAKLENENLIKEEFDKFMPGVEIDYEAAKEGIKRNVERYTAMLENAPEKRENIPSYYNLRPDMFYWTDDHNYREAELAMTQDEMDFRASNPKENLYLVSDKHINNEHLRLIVYNELPTLPGQDHNFGLFSREHYEIHFIRAKNDYLQTFAKALSGANPTNGTSEGVVNFDVPYPKLTISLDEAIDLAQEAFDILGIEDFYLANYGVIKANLSYEEYVQIQSENENFDMKEYHESKDDKFYLLTFKPKYNGIPLIHAYSRYSQQEIYALPFSFEEIKVKVSNNEIVEFKWSNPTDISNVINEKANLLPFSEVMDIALKHMELVFNMETIAPLWNESPTFEEDLEKFIDGEIKITEIRLGLGGVQAYNNPSEYMLVPIWNFYGSYDVEKIDEEHDYFYEDLYLPFISVNAVDGSIIEQVTMVNLD